MKRRALFCLPLLLLIILIFPLNARADAASGYCGGYEGDDSSVKWTLSDDHTHITISGTGIAGFRMDSGMPNYIHWGIAACPWYEYLDTVTSIEIQSGVTDVRIIGSPALTSITYPDNITTLELYRCPSITSLTIPSTVKQLHLECDSLSSVTIPYGVTDLYLRSQSLTSISIPGSVKTLALEYCSSLTSLTIPASVRTLASLRGCSSLTSLTIPSTVTELGQNAGVHPNKAYHTFAGCDSLPSITIPATVQYIYFHALDSLQGKPVYYCGTFEQWQNCSGGNSAFLTNLFFCSSDMNGWYHDVGELTTSGHRISDEYFSWDTWYYYEDGHPYNGWTKSGNKSYYIKNGVMQKDTFITEGEKTYLLDDDGALYTSGWIEAAPENSSEKRRFYANADGSLKTGWFKDESKWYYADSYFGEIVTGRQEIDGLTYYFTESGEMMTAWQEVTILEYEYPAFKEITRWFYYGPDGAEKHGWQKINGIWYYLNEYMRTNWQEIDGRWYYFGSDGAMRTGWKQISGSWYYFGSDGAMKSGWQNIGGTWYYLNNTMATGWKQISGSWYYFGSNGAMKSGWQQISGSWYYLGSDGAMKTGWKQISGSWYYFGSDGAMKTGWQNIGGTWYYLNNTMTTGWKQIGGTWYYFKANGAMAAGETLSIGGTYYSFAASGAWIQ